MKQLDRLCRTRHSLSERSNNLASRSKKRTRPVSQTAPEPPPRLFRTDSHAFRCRALPVRWR
jgi:hypothetical protein